MKVVITFDADPQRVGTTEDVPDEQAGEMVRTGRARYANTASTRKSRSSKKSQPEPDTSEGAA